MTLTPMHLIHTIPAHSKPLFFYSSRKRTISMNRPTFIQRVAVSIATVGFCFPQFALAATPQGNPSPTITDVRLHESGTLHGRIVTDENAAVADMEVALRSGEKTLVVGKTDRNGCFAFSGLCNGVYKLSTAKGQHIYRAWTARTAPPAAQPYALLVTDTVRGQLAMTTFRNWMANPWVIAGIIGAAVAIPVAIHNSNKPSSP